MFEYVEWAGYWWNELLLLCSSCHVVMLHVVGTITPPYALHGSTVRVRRSPIDYPLWPRQGVS